MSSPGPPRCCQQKPHSHLPPWMVCGSGDKQGPGNNEESRGRISRGPLLTSPSHLLPDLLQTPAALLRQDLLIPM
ncbi:hypothetical protein GDO81_010806 [Engystomops pustulosus]|uniref:Uncharacterized protein n=1 Tax=Engystomops pustulosus TaxID=76066 RepID=A0AAV7C3V3_ENGPU|nr:hypothetical protein GDO81_010806 [Engystomops pustulosus]